MSPVDESHDKSFPVLLVGRFADLSPPELGLSDVPNPTSHTTKMTRSLTLDLDMQDFIEIIKHFFLADEDFNQFGVLVHLMGGTGVIGQQSSDYSIIPDIVHQVFPDDLPHVLKLLKAAPGSYGLHVRIASCQWLTWRFGDRAKEYLRLTGQVVDEKEID